MRYALSTAIAIAALCLTAGHSRSQTSVIQQSITTNGEGSSVTINGRTITVDAASGGHGRVVGNGLPASQDRPIGPVTEIASDGAFELAVKVGPAPRLTIETDKNILPIVKTEVSNGRLNIFTDRSYSINARIKVSVSSPSISEISASGSNRINAGGFAGGPLSVALNGSNHVELAGNVSALTCRMSGSDRLSARQLVSDSVDVTISGSGDASVDARQKLAAEISGSGSIAVYGNPKDRSTQVNGSGKITFAE